MTRRRTPESAARRVRVVKLRRNRWTWDAIGADLGVSAQRAHQLYSAALAEVPVAQVEAHRAEETDLIDRATRELLALAEDSNVNPRTKVEAWNSLRGWAERKAKLLGLDAPTQTQATVVSASTFDQALKELEQEMEVWTSRKYGLEGDNSR
jgi:hypothetical protein